MIEHICPQCGTRKSAELLGLNLCVVCSGVLDEPTTNGYKPEVIADSSGEWTGNSLVFATEKEAQAWVADLRGRWMLVRDTRVIPTTESPNYSYLDYELKSIN